MSLFVKVISASSLPNVQRFSKSDPKAVVTFQGIKHTTKVVENSLDPVWNEAFEWPLQVPPTRTDVIWIEVFHHEIIGKNRLLGKSELSMRDIIAKGCYSERLKLKGKKGNILPSTITLDVKYTAPVTKRAIGGRECGGIAKGGSEDQDEGENTDEEEYEGFEGGGLTAPLDPSSNDTSALEKQRREKARAKLPDEPTDFQIQLHVIEACKLQGDGLNPVVKVSCGTHVKWTRSRKGTKNPLFDEILCFEIKEHPKDLFNTKVEMRVLNSKLPLLDSLIGFSIFDVGMAYDEQDHGFTHKWALLSDPDHPSRGSQGYLKFSITIVGPGEDPVTPSLNISPETVNKESNLLDPFDIRPQTKSLDIKIYHAEDLPQMDPDYFEGVKRFLTNASTVQNGLVDPYCVVKFAGHVGRTRVIWKEHDPKWNQEFNLAVMFPSMCERIRFRLKDKDKVGKDDYIGTCFLKLADISSPAETGFLPTFGPSFINIYGSPREFTNLPDKFEYLNKGGTEGVSYRGRVMIEVNMEKDKSPSEKHENIKSEDIVKLTPFLRRRRYKLFATFYSATMIKPANEAVTFEVSIGNYGLKHETDYPLQSSTTPPTHPLLYGGSYYYIPWTHQKPCVNIVSYWEDNTYRIESQNLLLFIAEGLKTSLERVRKIMIQEKYNYLCRDILMEAIQKAMGHIRQGIPELPSTAYTNLDKLKRSVREEDLSLMLDEARQLLRTEEGELKDDLTLSTLCDAAQEYYMRLIKLANEPQNSVPDVIIWMFSGQKRVACHRIPSNKVMFSASTKKRGRLCGQFQNIMLTPPALEKAGDLKGAYSAGALVRCVIWLGLEQEQSKWERVDREGKVKEFAETYENQVFNMHSGKWDSPGIMGFEWSDSEGKIKQQKEDFELAPGWEWASKWEISPVSAFYEDEGREELQEEMFELQFKKQSTFWPITISESVWYNNHGEELQCSKEKSLPRDNIKLKEGWAWSNEWQVDINRACDEDGWEYMLSSDFNTQLALKPFERKSHLCRRRRWARTRIYNRPSYSKTRKVLEEGWEYAKLHHMSYHCNKRETDMARRRRWLRKVVQTTPGHLNVFNVKSKDDESPMVQQSPRIFLSFKEPHKYQLRAYIFLARDLYASDKSGLLDPYCTVSFDHYSQCSVISKSLSPTWDQTLIFDNVRLFGVPTTVQKYPPSLVVELRDRESARFLGIVRCTPIVKLIPDSLLPSLEWNEILRYGQHSGDLLAASELLLDKAIDVPFELHEDPTQSYFTVPDGIRPSYRKMRIEVYCRGVRDLYSVTSPFVKIECGEKIEKTTSINVVKNSNFPDPLIIMDVDLPREEKYSPPLKIKVFDDHGYGQSTEVGTYVVESLQDFEVDPWESAGKQEAELDQCDTTAEQEEMGSDTPDGEEAEFDWWSKYYASINDKEMTQQEYLEEGHDLLEVYETELEDAFDEFEDIFQTFPLYQGKDTCDPDDPEGQTVGSFKGVIKVYPLPDDGSPDPPKVLGTECYFPPSEPVEVEVRVYIIKGIDLQPRDKDGKSDPYLVVSLGEEEISNDRDNYLAKTLNPLFGKMFKIPATLPLNGKLRVKVMDHDQTSADDLVGETVIDLENRFFTQYRAVCGLPRSFSRYGPNHWRDYELPKDILNWLCKTQGLPNPVWKGSEEVLVNEKTYNIKDIDMGQSKLHPDVGSPDQRLALYILHEQGLVPEHIETRTLYHPMYPGISQGALHMWVDIFPDTSSLPEPVDITPHIQNGLNTPPSPQTMVTNEEKVINEERGPPVLYDVFRLLKQKSHKWQEIGRDLDVNLGYRENLKKQGVQESDEGRLESILNKWIESECSEVSWKHFINVLKELELNDAARDVVTFLLSPEAVKKYTVATTKDSADNL